MKVHWLQHVPLESLDAIAPWLRSSHSHLQLSRIRLYLNKQVPDAGTHYLLIIVAGTRRVHA